MSMDSDSLVSWLLGNLKVNTDPKSQIRGRDIAERYTSTNSTKVDLVHIGKIIRKLFPRIKTTYPRNKQTGKQETAYQYIEFRGDEQAEAAMLTMENITNYIPKNCAVLLHTNDKVTFTVPTQFLCNGNILSKKVTIHNSEWNLSVRERDIELDSIGVDNIFDWTIDGMNRVLSIVDKLQICTGIPISDLSHLDWHMDNNTCFQEYVSNIGDENSGSKVIRYKNCNQILRWLSLVTSCHACQYTIRRNRKQENTNKEENVILNEEDQEDMSEILERVFPNATADMKCLLESQRKALSCKDRKGMKWDKRIISMCLSLWVRSPKNYQDIRDSNMLILPSGRQLRKYKNKVNQEPGLNDEVLNWMYMAAKENQLEEHGYAGGLVHDETKIQEGVALDMRSGCPKLIGWIDTGEENHLAKILKENTMKSTLATHVLQIMFVGYTGFRFPVCHYPTCVVKASELHTILWSTIKKLHDWGFLVDYIMQDGGEENRQFIKSNFDGDELEKHYLSPNLVDPTCVVAHIQDFSHNMKKLRNSILSSGHKPFHKRLVQKNDLYIIWGHWISAVKWDREVNTRPLCHKITDQHLYPNSSEKMRNHLAEDMLNEDFLYLMEAFQSDLHDGSHLNSSMQLLKHTSRIISVFRDSRPVTSLSDCRFQILQDAFDWFQDWKKEITQLKTTGVNTVKKLISPKCLEDVENMLLTFKEICVIHFNRFPHGYVVPSRINSDIVENHFCQQRGLYNGSTTNPTYMNYCSTVNSIVLGQSLKSRGRKSNAGLVAASSYSMCTGDTLSSSKKIKLLKNLR